RGPRPVLAADPVRPLAVASRPLRRGGRRLPLSAARGVGPANGGAHRELAGEGAPPRRRRAPGRDGGGDGPPPGRRPGAGGEQGGGRGRHGAPRLGRRSGRRRRAVRRARRPSALDVPPTLTTPDVTRPSGCSR